jgi:tRNA C32,U32 (ribose-2'-O)-methylase TrmJ
MNDPRNLGSIARSAGYFGAHGLVLSRASCDITPAVAKTASGAIEALQLRKASADLASFLQESRNQHDLRYDPALLADQPRRSWGSLCIVGLTLAPQSISCAELSRTLAEHVPAAAQSQTPFGVLLVVGSEGEGMDPLVAAQCHVQVRIDHRRPAAALAPEQRALKALVAKGITEFVPEDFLSRNVLDSLNVSNAAAIALHEITNHVHQQ